MFCITFRSSQDDENLTVWANTENRAEACLRAYLGTNHERIVADADDYEPGEFDGSEGERIELVQGEGDEEVIYNTLDAVGCGYLDPWVTGLKESLYNRRYLVEAVPYGLEKEELYHPKCVAPEEWTAFKAIADGVLIAIRRGFEAPIWRCEACGGEIKLLEIWPEEELP